MTQNQWKNSRAFQVWILFLGDAILTYNAKFFGDYMITSDILGKLVIYDNKNFNVVTK
jgi:hypothetical protein